MSLPTVIAHFWGGPKDGEVLEIHDTEIWEFPMPHNDLYMKADPISPMSDMPPTARYRKAKVRKRIPVGPNEYFYHYQFNYEGQH